MRDVPALDLASIGEGGLPLRPDADPAFQAACVRLVQRPHAERRFAVGLLPADDGVAIPPLALHLGWALARLARRRVGIVDANVRYPAFPGASARRGDEAHAERGDSSASLFTARRIDDALTLISPRSAGGAGAGVPQLELILERYRETFAHLVADLTGFQRLGDHLNAVVLLDGVILVARARASREADLLRLKSELPEERTLGVILVR